MVQIEHIKAVENAREILSVPGIDGYFIGPGDLCASMGLPNTWDPDFPEYWAALDKVQRVARELGIPSGIHASPGRVAAMLEKGYRFVAVGFDISFMASAATAALQTARLKPAAR
jgi:2-keto-3-deoxy-L-rhamnonate aldolase RhmA